MRIVRSTILFASALSLLASPVLAADPPKPVPGKIAAADLSDDQVLDCLSRMISLSNAARNLAKDPSSSEADRATYSNLDDQTSMAVTFYAGLLYSRPWVADRHDQMARIEKTTAAEDNDTKSKKAMACLTRSSQGVVDTLHTITSQ